MIRTVKQSYNTVNNRIPCQYAGLHCALDTSVNSRDVLFRDRAADDLVAELITLTGFVRVPL